MSEVFAQLPAWASQLVGWLLTGTNIASLLGIIAAIIKIGSSSKANKAVTNTQIDLLNRMVDKLSDTKQLAQSVQDATKLMSDSLAYFEKALTDQRQANANLATFVMECFNRSNLSAEAKAELQIMADRIFYDDNTQVIEALKAAKLQADEAVEQGLSRIAELEAELEAERKKLSTAQESVKASRRL